MITVKNNSHKYYAMCELKIGDTFVYEDNVYAVTRHAYVDLVEEKICNCIRLNNMNLQHLNSSTLVEKVNIEITVQPDI